MPRVTVIQHAAVEGLGRIAKILDEHGIEFDPVKPEDFLPATAIRHTDGLIILGGPMSVYRTDQYPRLIEEMHLIENALERDVPILGLCLGSQLLAAVLGARVCPGPVKEIGWHEVFLEPAAKTDQLFCNLPPHFFALHWHGDIFDPPSEARSLAHSAITRCQAFSYRTRAWGLLFHLEAGVDEVRAMEQAFPDEVRAAKTTPQTLLDDTLHHERNVEPLAAAVFGQWAKLVQD